MIIFLIVPHINISSSPLEFIDYVAITDPFLLLLTRYLNRQVFVMKVNSSGKDADKPALKLCLVRNFAVLLYVLQSNDSRCAG